MAVVRSQTKKKMVRSSRSRTRGARTARKARIVRGESLASIVKRCGIFNDKPRAMKAFQALVTPLPDGAHHPSSMPLGATHDAALKKEMAFDAAMIDRMVREAAYYRWINRGYCHGNDLYDWFESERELRARVS